MLSIVPLAIVGPSGVGKGTLIRHLQYQHPTLFDRSISYTTRKPRTTEVDKVDYNFVDESTFMNMVSRKDMIEFASVHGRYYGTSRQHLKTITDRGKIPLLDIDIKGADSISKVTKLNAVFLLPPSWSILQERLRGRGSQTQQSLKRRLARGREQVGQALGRGDLFEFMVNYDYRISAYGLRNFLKIKYNIDRELAFV